MSLFSSHWYRVAPLKPRLRRDVVLFRQTHGGRPWYVAHDLVTARLYRFDQPAWRVIGLMDGERTLEQIWRLAAEKLGDRLPTQDEMLALVARLHQSDLLVVDRAPDYEELSHRRDKLSRQQLFQKIKSPFAVRVPLFDPDRFLAETVHLFRWLISPLGLALWAMLMVAAILLAALHWQDLSTNALDRVLSLSNVGLMLLVYPLIKTVHELGHAYAVKRWGGEVHDIGVMVLLFFPVPYVDASAATAWPDKWQRAAVAAMGILVETTLAAVALLVWISVEPGIVSAIAFAVMITAGMTTVLFNGNPLLRFDGYYVLSDLAELPNLGQRGDATVSYLVRRWGFGLQELKSPAVSSSEAAILVAYSLTAFAYRLAIGFAIFVFISEQFFALGWLLACLYLFQLLLLPMAKGVHYVLTSSELQSKRRRAQIVVTGAVGLTAALLLLAPVPYGTVLQGVVWVPETARVVTESPGFVVDVVAAQGTTLEPRAVVARLANEEYAARVSILKAQVRMFEARVAGEVNNGPAAVLQARQQLEHARNALSNAEARVEGLVVRSVGAGVFVPKFQDDQHGRFIERGATLGYVIDPGAPTVVRLAVSEFEAELIRGRARRFEAEFASVPDKHFLARLVREVPAARDTLPSKALSREGAGPYALDPADPDRLKTLQHVVVFECEIDGAPPLERVGGRVFMRVDLGAASIGEQIYRPFRQLLLRQLKV